MPARLHTVGRSCGHYLVPEFAPILLIGKFNFATGRPLPAEWLLQFAPSLQRPIPIDFIGRGVNY